MLEDAVTRHVCNLLGESFLAYALNTSVAEISARLDADLAQLPDPAEQALGDLVEHALRLLGDAPFGESPALPDGAPSDRVRRFGWVDLDAGESQANTFRLAVGGDLPPVPDGLDAVEDALALIALDYYPVTLIPAAPENALPQKPMIARARVDALAAALKHDPLAGLMDPDVVFYTSVGMGYGPMWPFRIAECAVSVAEQRARAVGGTSAVAYLDLVLENVRLMRSLYTNGHAEVPALIGISNVERPEEEVRLRGPRGTTIRAAAPTDPNVPMAEPAALVLETVCDVGFSVGRMPPASGSFYDGATRLAVDEKLVSLAGLLATAEEEQRAMPIVCWTKVFDPFQPYVGQFRSDRWPPTIEIPATALPAFERWLLLLDRWYDPSIRVSITRCVSAFADRSTWDDSLIDLVIALENLFGGKGSNLAGQLSAAVSRLLGKTAEDRAEIGERVEQVYAARSDLVHGDELADDGAHPVEEAERVLLAAFKALLTERPELIRDRKARRRLARIR